MKQGNKIVDRILTIETLNAQLNRCKLLGKNISFTKGVFDILHEGHVKVLTQAASFADILLVGVNSDASVKRLKGSDRPVNTQDSRALLLASLLIVDAVIIFEEDTPLNLINTVRPDVLVKGGDYNVATIVGAKEVIENKGKVEVIPLEPGFSTTGIIEKLKKL